MSCAYAGLRALGNPDPRAGVCCTRVQNKFCDDAGVVYPSMKDFLRQTRDCAEVRCV